MAASALSLALASLHVPSNLEDVAKSLERALSKNFTSSSVQVVDCPDLQKAPYHLAAAGLGGHPVIADVGGVDNLHYPENNGTHFQLEEVASTLGRSGAFLMGPSCGTRRNTKVLSELIVNTDLAHNNIRNISSIVTPEGAPLQGTYHSNEIGGLGNFLVSEGQPAKVLHIKASTRTGDLNFVSCLRKALEADYPEALGLAGVFAIKKGNIKAHIMPDFPGHDMLTVKQIDEWLKFYEMHAPLTCVSVFVTKDTQNLGLRLEHTHFFSDHNEAGHYHYDVTPKEVEYEGYYVLCETVYRVQPPTISADRTAFFQK